MDAVEATIPTINTSSVLRGARKHAKCLVCRERGKELKRYDKEELLALIDASIKQSKEGNVYSWEDVRKEAREKYGF